MKKQLLGTSAIALGVAMAAPASAQDWDLDWGGFMSSHIAYSDVSGNISGAGADFDGVDTFTTGEIQFTPSVTLDNGLTFGINVQYETQTNGGAFVDEQFMSISGDSFGRLDIGNENSAGYKSMVGAPGVTSMYINSPSISAFLPLSTGQGGPLPWNFRQAAISTYTEVAGNNDVPRITYYTPTFNGLRLGVSYAASGAVNAGNNFAPNRNALAIEDIFDVGVNYSQSFGSTDISFGARYGTANSNVVGVSDPDTWGVGFQIGFSGFTVGGSWTENDNGGALGVGDQEGWSFGATYDAAGPWSFEALTYQGEYTGTGTAGADEDYEAYRIGASRDIGPGVDWDLYVAYVEADDNGTLGTDVEGTVVGTAINLSF